MCGVTYFAFRPRLHSLVNIARTMNEKKVSLFAAFKALIVRLIYAANGIILTFFVHDIIKEGRVFILNALLIPSAIEVIVTLKYKRRGEWTWFIPSVFIYLLWVVPCIIILEIYALNFRRHVVDAMQMSTTCPVVFYDECRSAVVEAMEEEADTHFDSLLGANITDHVLDPATHDLSRRYSSIFQQIMMLVIIFGRWMAPKGKLSHDQFSSLLLALTAMSLDMLEFATDSLSIEAVACDKIYVGFIIAVWCWSLLQIPLGLTAVKQRKPRIAGPIESRDSSDDSTAVQGSKPNGFNCKASCCCYCESEIWSLMVSIFMQDGPYLILRLYIMFSTGYVGETLIFFAAKNGLIVALQSYRVSVKVHQGFRRRRKGLSVKRHSTLPAGNSHPVVNAKSLQNGGFTGEGETNTESVVVTISRAGSDNTDDGATDQGEDAFQVEEETRSSEVPQGQEGAQSGVSAVSGFQEVALEICEDDESLQNDEL
ncbi:transmembrane protein 26-like isoform X1 [Lytechinus pictus]|uniref:transmembrane protein 26-like isoform X1 n=2 Tax=Lytechinus pictus TaxID=7653 RepID=UPI0030B9F8BB